MDKLKVPFSITALSLMMAACGGGSNQISEDPTVRPDGPNAVGCTISSTNSNCFEFTMEYPVAGIQYTCTSDKVNVFSTKVDGNTVKGGCDKDDTVTFFINATDTSRVELGSVKISDLGAVSWSGAPVHLTVLDMARGITGKAAESLSLSDETAKVAVSLVKIFQAIGSQKVDSHVVGDIQRIELDRDRDALKDLDKITQGVDAKALKDGSYANILKPWIDTSQISDDQALAVLKDVSNLTHGALYQADISPLASVMDGFLGHAGTGASKKSLIGIFHLLSDRQGFTQGTGIQWRGTPDRNAETDVGGALTMMLKSPPVRMHAEAQAQFINPVNKYLATADGFKFETSENENLFIHQGRLLNDYVFAGGETYYKLITGKKEVVQSDLTKWRQTVGSDQYEGGADFFKAFPIAYLDNKVFQSSKTVKTGEKYHFPLYATLTFKFDEKDLTDIPLGIVIDENGDIRTDVKDWSTKTNLSGQCGVADASSAKPKDHYDAPQYRIGTLAATNYQPNQQDLGVAPRIILSGEHFGVLDGTLLGVNSDPIPPLGGTQVNANGVKINLYNLITDGSTGTNAINLTAFRGGPAVWFNIYHAQLAAYLEANKNTYTPTTEESDLSKRMSGTVTIKLTDCYEIKTKS